MIGFTQGCDFYGITSGLFGFVSIFTLTIMSIERYFVVNDPFKSSGFGPKLKLFCIFVCWFYAAFLITLQMFSKNGFILEGFLTSCSFDYLSRDPYSRSYMLLMIFGGFLVPLILILVFYSFTELKLKKLCSNIVNFRNMSAKTSNTQFSRSNPKNLSSQALTKQYGNKIIFNSIGNHQLQRRAKRSNTPINILRKRNNQNSVLNREFRVLKMILLNVCLFCLAWTPYAVIVIFAQFGSNTDSWLTPFTASLPAVMAKISSIYNPILYTLSNRECRMYFAKAFRRNSS